MRGDTEHIRALEARPWLPRTLGYLRLMGPGYMQSAMTLGGGTAFAAIFAGAAFGYQLLWVAPLAMLLGIIVLAAVAHQTLSTDANPFAAMRQHAGPVFAYGWAIGGIVSSIIWQFAQYALASSMLVAIAAQRTAMAGAVVASWACCALAWCVDGGAAVRPGQAEASFASTRTIIKGTVWFIIAWPSASWC